VVGARLEQVRVRGLSVLRTVEPAIESLDGARAIGLERAARCRGC
jgi:hypothetical protein